MMGGAIDRTKSLSMTMIKSLSKKRRIGSSLYDEFSMENSVSEMRDESDSDLSPQK